MESFESLPQAAKKLARLRGFQGEQKLGFLRLLQAANAGRRRAYPPDGRRANLRVGETEILK